VEIVDKGIPRPAGEVDRFVKSFGGFYSEAVRIYHGGFEVSALRP